jgi:ketosteroid isomerase-like protein
VGEGPNTEAVRSLIEALNRDDMDSAVEHVDPEAELRPLRAKLEGSTYRGHQGLRQMNADLRADWADLRFEIEELRESGDAVAVRGSLAAHGLTSGVDLAVPIGLLLRFRAGKLVYWESVSDPDAPFGPDGPS